MLRQQKTKMQRYLQLKLMDIVFRNGKSYDMEMFATKIQHFLQIYNTSSYLCLQNKLDFQQFWPLELLYIPHLNHNKPNLPFVKISIQSCSSESYFQTAITSAIVHTLYQNSINNKNNQSNQNYHLLFPIFNQNQQQSGDLRVKIQFTNNSAQKSSQELSKNNIFRGTTSSIHNKYNHRKILVAKDHLYCQPIVTKSIFVCLSSDQEELSEDIPIQEEKKKMNSFKNSKLHENLQQRSKKQYFQQFKEDISLIKVKSSEEGKGMSYQQLQEINVFNKTSQNSSGTQRQKEFTEQSELPLDYRHLFDKIDEINRKYAPLERISSQNELSQSINSYDINQNIDQQSLEKLQSQEDKLNIYEKFIKELNLYPFAKSISPNQ